MRKNFVLIGLIAAGYLSFISGSGASGLAVTNGGVGGEKSVAAAPAETASAGGGAVETRCGWFANPTPANAWLNDRAGEWTVGVQGGYQAEGDWPSFKKSQWVKTNGNYGYGCACIRGTFNAETGQVVKIRSAYARPLSACKKDKALKAPVD